MTSQPPLAVTMGDPAGIGPEITAKAWLARRRRGSAFFVLADPAVFSGLAPVVPGLRTATIDAPGDAPGLFADALPVLPLGHPVRAVPGHPDGGNSGAVVASIEQAVAFVREGHAAAVVTNPIAKATLYEAGFRFPGHTEFLAHLADVPRTVMMLACDGLRVVPVTIHVPLSTVPRLLDRASIVETGTILAQALRRDVGIANPRIVVAGLNPHAGEGGTMGTEDRDVVAPAVTDLRDRGIDAVGPLPADTMFHARARDGYDAALCMYHDQALIPIKTIDFDGGVNMTLGLPFVRTSPDHGTAFDIAGRGVARPNSLLAALDAAAAMAARRATLPET